jgi:hypothetical protein
MSYVPTTWSEAGMTTQQKVDGLNHIETQYIEGVAYIDALYHDSMYYTQASADSTFYRTSAHPSGRSDTGHGCGIDAALVDGYTKAQLQALAVPSGCIAVWALTQASIPSGWHLCDGLAGSPDLRGRFLLGAGSGYNPGATGGSSSVIPTASSFNPDAVALTTNQIPRHTHSYVDIYNNIIDKSSGTNSWYQTIGQGDTTTTGINGTPNTSCVAHGHDGSSFTWSGYYDQNDQLQSGSLPIMPPAKAYCYILRL